MQAIKELADRLDGKPAQMLEHSGPDSEPITKVRPCPTIRGYRVSIIWPHRRYGCGWCPTSEAAGQSGTKRDICPAVSRLRSS